jgi:hypothetical protein
MCRNDFGPELIFPWTRIVAISMNSEKTLGESMADESTIDCDYRMILDSKISLNNPPKHENLHKPAMKITTAGKFKTFLKPRTQSCPQYPLPETLNKSGDAQ